jgi:hypothetical protein
MPHDTVTKLPTQWFIYYKPRWFEWWLKGKGLGTLQTITEPVFHGYSVGINATKPKCDHFDKFIGIIIPQSGELGQVCESAKFTYCPKCGSKL